MLLGTRKNLLGIVVLIAAAFALAACGPKSQERTSSAHQLTKVDFLLDWSIEPNYVGFFVAQEKGYFAKRGLDVKFQEGTGGDVTAQVVAVGNRYVIGSASGGATAIGRAHGLPIRSVAVIFPVITTVIFSRVSDPIRKPSDLVGHTIGLVGGSVTVDEYRALLRANNIDRSKIKEVGVSEDPSPLLTGKVDALIDYGDQMPASLIAKGTPLVLLKLSDYGVHEYGLNIIANDSALSSDKGNSLRDTAEAIAEGYEFVRSHPDEAIEMFMKRFPQKNRAYVTRSIQMVVSELGTAKVGTQDAPGWSQTIQTLDALGLLPKRVAVDDVLDAGGKSH